MTQTGKKILLSIMVGIAIISIVIVGISKSKNSEIKLGTDIPRESEFPINGSLLEKIEHYSNLPAVKIDSDNKSKIRDVVILGYPEGESCWDALKIQNYLSKYSAFRKEFMIDERSGLKGRVDFYIDEKGPIDEASLKNINTSGLLNMNVKKELHLFRNGISSEGTQSQEIVHDFYYCGSDLSIRSFNQKLILLTGKGNQFAEGESSYESPKIIFNNAVYNTPADLLYSSLGINKEEYNNIHDNNIYASLSGYDDKYLVVSELNNISGPISPIINGYLLQFYFETDSLNLVFIKQIKTETNRYNR